MSEKKFNPAKFPVVHEFRAKTIDDQELHISVWDQLTDAGRCYEVKYVNLDSYAEGHFGLDFKKDDGEVVRFSSVENAEKEIRKALTEDRRPTANL